jgi:hypothetical protein
MFCLRYQAVTLLELSSHGLTAWWTRGRSGLKFEEGRPKYSPGKMYDLCLAHYISNKELRRYFRKWQEGKRKDESLLPAKIGAKPGSRRTRKTIECNIMKA